MTNECPNVAICGDTVKIDAWAEAKKLYALGWKPETVRDFHRSMCALHDWTEDECEAVATELEGMIG